MEKLLVKVDGCYIFAPNEEQWAGMDSLMKTIVKKVGGLIDFPLKDRLVADYNTGKLHKKYDLIHDERVPQQLLEILYPRYLAVHKFQYQNAGAQVFPESISKFFLSIKNETQKQFQNKEKIRLKMENERLLKWHQSQNSFTDFDFQYFRTMNENEFKNLGNEEIDKLALQLNSKIVNAPASKSIEEIQLALFVNQKPLLWQYHQNMNSNRTMLNQYLKGAVTSYNSVADKYLRSSRQQQFEMLTRENKFFVIKSLREHEVLELAIIRKKPFGIQISTQLFEKCQKTTEEWFNDELRELSTVRCYSLLESLNLPLLTYHLQFVSKYQKVGPDYQKQIEKFLAKLKQCHYLEDDEESQIPHQISAKQESLLQSEEKSQTFRLSQEILCCTCCSYSAFNGPDEQGILRKMLGCMRCNVLICEQPCYPKYQEVYAKKERKTYYDYVLKTWTEKVDFKELFCPTCRTCDWSQASLAVHRQRADDILQQNQNEIAQKLEVQANINAAKVIQQQQEKNKTIEEFLKPVTDEFNIFPGQQRFYISKYVLRMQQKHFDMKNKNPVVVETVSDNEYFGEEYTSEYFYTGGYTRLNLEASEQINISPDQIDSRARQFRKNSNSKKMKGGFKYEDDEDFEPEQKRRRYSSQRQ